MITPKIVADAIPVEELIEIVGTLAPGETVPAHHFALAPRTPPTAPEMVTRFVRPGERVETQSALYKVSRIRRRAA